MICCRKPLRDGYMQKVKKGKRSNILIKLFNLKVLPSYVLDFVIEFSYPAYHQRPYFHPLFCPSSIFNKWHPSHICTCMYMDGCFTSNLFSQIYIFKTLTSHIVMPRRERVENSVNGLQITQVWVGHSSLKLYMLTWPIWKGRKLSWPLFKM